jgi:hypothetical protein
MKGHSMNDEKRFALNLPFYANGTLEVKENEWMQNYILQHPEYAVELELAELEIKQVRQTKSSVAEDERVKKLIAQIRDIDNSTGENISRIKGNWLDKWLSGALTVGLMASVSLNYFQANRNEDERLTRSVTKNCTMKSRIRITIQPTVSWIDVVQLLRKVQVQVVTGPNEIGDIWGEVAADTSMPEVLVVLRNSPMVEQVIADEQKDAPKGCRS